MIGHQDVKENIVCKSPKLSSRYSFRLFFDLTPPCLKFWLGSVDGNGFLAETDMRSAKRNLQRCSPEVTITETHHLWDKMKESLHKSFQPSLVSGRLLINVWSQENEMNKMGLDWSNVLWRRVVVTSASQIMLLHLTGGVCSEPKERGEAKSVFYISDAQSSNTVNS